ncbi:MAG: tetratricopeptide repeat protein [Deltaproteobacteria bacterium]|nr:tetratricopeptide repeat protein [Deltaproteobacteria bacterium]
MNTQQIKKCFLFLADSGFRSLSIVLAVALIAILLSACAGDYARKRAEYYYLQGQSLANQGQTERAIKKFEKSMDLSEKTGFVAGIAHNLNELAIIHTTAGEFDAARSELSRALDIYRSLDMKPEVSKTLNNISQTYAREGRFEDAILH